MDLEIRPVVADELPAFVRTDVTAFAEQPTDELVETAQLGVELDRSLAAFHRGRMVATAGAMSLELTLPGTTTTAAAGVTWVGVLPTHRRRGILRALMERQLADVAARGEVVAVLLASESTIYGRFGYGPATWVTGVELDTRYGSFVRPPADTGSISLLDADEAAKVLPEVHERARRRRPGEVSRPAYWWEMWFRDPEQFRDGMGARFYAVHERLDGTPDGYIAYRAKPDWHGFLPSNRLAVTEMTAEDDDVRAALWRFVLDVDLVTSVTAPCPPDEPLRWLLADSRRLRVTECHDLLWVRLIDVDRALAARRYALPGRLVLEVTDRSRPSNQGRRRLEGSPDGAECEPTKLPADLALDVADLGAAYLGGVTFSTLARAGRVSEQAPGGLERADAMFGCRPAPFCSTEF